MAYFLFGILFHGCILPLLKAFTAYMQNLIAVSNAKALLKIAKLEVEIDKLDDKSNDTRAIGFVVESATEEDEDDE